MNETYYIPANFTDAGRVMGLFELRNLVEAVILVLPVLYFCLVLLPLELTAKITVTLIIVVPLPLATKRRLMTYRGGKN